MRASSAVLFALLFPLAGCGGSGGDGGGEGNAALFRGPLMYLGAQFELYGSPGNFLDLNRDGLKDVYSVGYDDAGEFGLFVGLGVPEELVGPQLKIAPANGEPAAGDFNRDGLIDIVVSVSVDGRGLFDSDIEIFYLQPDGSFTPGGLMGFEVDFPIGVVTGDFDGNGLIDLVANDTTLLNRGASFEAFPFVSVVDPFDSPSVADVNNDGFDDLLFSLAHPSSSYASVLLSNGDGTFEAPRTFVGNDHVPLPPPADFNRDGFSDFLTVRIEDSADSDGHIDVYMGDAAAGYSTVKSSQLPFPYGDFQWPIKAADFDEDGRLDLLLVRSVYTGGNDYEFRYARGLGDGTFSTDLGPAYESDGPPIDAEDLDRDGHLDVIAFADTTAKLNVVFFGNGDGTFDTLSLPSLDVPGLYGLVPVFGDSTRAPDMDSDGRADIVARSAAADSVYILYGRADGDFDTTALVPTLDNPFTTGQFIADLDDDGDLDILAPHNGSGVATILRNYGGRTMQPVSVNLPGFEPEFVGDVDGDHRTDLLYLTGGGFLASYGLGNAAFEAPAFISSIVYPNSWYSVGDVNGDGIPDVYGLQPGGDNYDLFVIRGAGGRNFLTGFSSLDSLGNGVTREAFADHNSFANGTLDFAGFRKYVPTQIPEIITAYGDVDGAFHQRQSFLVPVTDVDAVCNAVTDLDQDGDRDVLCELFTEEFLPPDATHGLTLLNDGQGIFSQASYFRSYLGFSGMSSLVDVNGDEFPDIVNLSQVGFSVALSNGDGTFGTTHYFATPTAVYDYVVGDFDGDGDGDILGGEANGTFGVILENRLIEH